MPQGRLLLFLATLVSAVLVCPIWVHAQAADESVPDIPELLRESVQFAVAKVKPALVRIQVVSPWYAGGREIKSESSGSGVIISPEGHVLTNHHVAGRATRILCVLATKEELEADIVGRDPLTDIAVLKLRTPEPRVFPSAEFGDSSLVRVGDHVLAMGSPMALSQSVTLGIVSNTEMVMPRWLGPWRRVDEEGEDVGSFVRWIGHDADIYGGNSGGPLVDLQGRIIGINEIRMALSGAIPGNLARRTAEELIAHGRVKRSWLGIEVQPRLKHGAQDRGVLVSSVLDGSPAAQAGLKPGDHLLRIADDPVDVRFDEEIPMFNHRVAELPLGEPVQILLRRGDEEVTAEIVPVEREEALPRQFELRQWGVTVQDLSLLRAKELKRDSRDGVLVTSVRPGGPAGDARPPIEERDIITSVNDIPVNNVEQLREVTATISEGRTEPVPVLVHFDRRAQRLITVVKVGIRELDDPGREVKKAWLPVETQVVSREIAEQLGRPDLKGFRVTRVYPGTTAEEAGLLVGDIITAVDDMPLEATRPEEYEELAVLIRQYRIDSLAVLKLLRDDAETSLEVALPEAPRQPRELKRYRDDSFEFTVRDIDFLDRAREKWEQDQAGLLVEEVTSGGWAALGQLGVDDLILSVDGHPAGDVDTFRGHMRRIAEERPRSVVFHIRRGIHTLFIELEPQWNDLL